MTKSDYRLAEKFLNQVDEARQKLLIQSYTVDEMQKTSKGLISTLKEFVSGGYKIHDLGYPVERLEAEKEKLIKAARTYTEKQAEINEFIINLNVNRTVQSVLIAHYVYNKDFKSIAIDLQYSYSHLMKAFHKVGLEAVATKLKELYT